MVFGVESVVKIPTNLTLATAFATIVRCTRAEAEKASGMPVRLIDPLMNP